MSPRLHSTLKARAALAGQSLSEYLLAELERVAARPTPEELRKRLEKRKSVRSRVPRARAVRAARDRR